MSKLTKMIIEWLTGGIAYFYIEILFRGYSHFSMMVCGGFCFIGVGAAGRYILEKDRSIILNLVEIMLVGMLVITLMELITGYIVNISLNLNVWDYSDMKYNFYGQICPLFSFFWAGISLVCVYIDGLMQRFLFNEPMKEQKVH